MVPASNCHPGYIVWNLLVQKQKCRITDWGPFLQSKALYFKQLSANSILSSSRAASLKRVSLSPTQLGAHIYLFFVISLTVKTLIMEISAICVSLLREVENTSSPFQPSLGPAQPLHNSPLQSPQTKPRQGPAPYILPCSLLEFTQEAHTVHSPVLPRQLYQHHPTYFSDPRSSCLTHVGHLGPLPLFFSSNKFTHFQG